MLLLQLANIILANAAWLDGLNHSPFHHIIIPIANLSLLCLPVYTALCSYSVGLRIAQYGLSVDRVQAMFLTLVTAMWSLGYAGAVVFRKWPVWIGRVNMFAVAVLVVIVGAMNSPILDPYRLAAYNQLSRLKSGSISPEDFDYIYTRFNLGRFGRQVLTELAASSSPGVRIGVSSAMSISPSEYLSYLEDGILPVSRRKDIISRAQVYPSGRYLEPEDILYLANNWIFTGVNSASDIVFMYVDVESGAHNLLALSKTGGIIYTLGDTLKPSGSINGTFNPQSLDIMTSESRFKDLVINGSVYQIQR